MKRGHRSPGEIVADVEANFTEKKKRQAHEYMERTKVEKTSREFKDRATDLSRVAEPLKTDTDLSSTSFTVNLGTKNLCDAMTDLQATMSHAGTTAEKVARAFSNAFRKAMSVRTGNKGTR